MVKPRYEKPTMAFSDWIRDRCRTELVVTDINGLSVYISKPISHRRYTLMEVKEEVATEGYFRVWMGHYKLFSEFLTIAANTNIQGVEVAGFAIFYEDPYTGAYVYRVPILNSLDDWPNLARLWTVRRWAYKVPVQHCHKLSESQLISLVEGAVWPPFK